MTDQADQQIQTRIELLLFDLGGVLVDFSGVRDVARWLRTPMTDRDIRDRFGSCPHVNAFGNGRISSEEFGELFVRDWGIRLSPQEFLKEFQTWSRCLLPGAAELLSLLRPRFRLAALSNSNELHWERNTKQIGVTSLFELAISSHQVGCSKPDPSIYRIGLERLKVSPDVVMFFDDVQANVDAALEIGMRAFRVDGVSGVRDRLIAEGLGTASELA